MGDEWLPADYLAGEKVVNRIWRSLCELEVVEEALVRSMTRLESMRYELVSLGMSHRSNNLNFGGKDRLLWLIKSE